MSKGQKNPRLYLDNAPCHKKDELTNYLTDLNIDFSFIPPRLKHLLQPPDLCLFKSIKKAYHDKWTNWYINEIWEDFDPSII